METDKPHQPGRPQFLTGGDVVATLHFYNPPQDESEPVFYVTDSSGAGIKNYGHDPKQVLVRDLRHKEGKFSLHLHSFAAFSGTPTDGIDFSDQGDVEQRYGPVVEELILRHLPGSTKVVIFDMTIRKAGPDEVLRRPVRKVHVDQSPSGAYHRARRHLPKVDADQVGAGKLRLRIVNVWKPLIGPVMDYPLAMAESLTVKDHDLIPVKHMYPHAIGETYAVKFSPEQRFWYWSNMTTNEYLMLQCFDSRPHLDDLTLAQNPRCAHASFNPACTERPGCSRQSIEVRCLVLGG
jgi:hypothetical protein